MTESRRHVTTKTGPIVAVSRPNATGAPTRMWTFQDSIASEELSSTSTIMELFPEPGGTIEPGICVHVKVEYSFVCPYTGNTQVAAFLADIDFGNYLADNLDDPELVINNYPIIWGVGRWSGSTGGNAKYTIEAIVVLDNPYIYFGTQRVAQLAYNELDFSATIVEVQEQDETYHYETGITT